MDDPALLYLEVYLWRFNYYSYRYPECAYEEFIPPEPSGRDRGREASIYALTCYVNQVIISILL